MTAAFRRSLQVALEKIRQHSRTCPRAPARQDSTTCPRINSGQLVMHNKCCKKIVLPTFMRAANAILKAETSHSLLLFCCDMRRLRTNQQPAPTETSPCLRTSALRFQGKRNVRRRHQTRWFHVFLLCSQIELVVHCKFRYNCERGRYLQVRLTRAL